jgi:glucose/arabinose dehydrogenase
MAADHPIIWAHEYQGGRAWYTGLGHTAASYSEPLFLNHLLGGIRYAAGQEHADTSATDESNFQVDVLDDNTLNPMELAVAADGRVIYVERGGRVKVYRPDQEDTVIAGQIAVFSGLEDGLLGVTLDPGFIDNGWVYFFYSPAGPVAEQHISRFTMVDNQLVDGSERVLLEIPTQRAQCCHSAGSLTFGPGGQLWISTGDNTNPFESSGYAPIDERPGRSPWDAQKSSSNTDDLRGKILRIVPQDDGSYTIPDGNLFAADGSQGRPEIFAMGNRNPFRISVDPQTGWLYWGDVGPDASSSSLTRGPNGHDEINQARQAGNFGWPYFVADNRPYREFNFATNLADSFFDPDQPVNNSPNNTGSQLLPPAQGAFIWYPGGVSSEFPELGTGGRTAMAGPVYQYDPDLESPYKLPEYYDDTLFIYEWSRRWIKEVKLDEDGQVLKINPFLPSLQLRRPIDMEVGPDGAIYVLEWGSGFSGNNSDSQLIRIGYVRPLPGDSDGDADVDSADLLAFLENWTGRLDPGIGMKAFEDGDLDGDADVDSADLLTFLASWTGSLASRTAQPQPLTPGRAVSPAPLLNQTTTHWATNATDRAFDRPLEDALISTPMRSPWSS